MTRQQVTMLIPYSPKGVFDFDKVVFEVQNAEELQEKLAFLRTPLSVGGSSSPLLPPLINLSVCSRSVAGGDDELSSVSSVSLEDDDLKKYDDACASQGSQKRCIFARYWETKGGRPKVPSTVVIEDDLSTLDTVDESERFSLLSTGSYEKLLEKNESPVTPIASARSKGQRRRLFDNNRYVSYQSAPSLPQYVPATPCLRKARSESVVSISSPKVSCLRECRYSGSSRRSRRASDSSVSFSAQVQIQYLKPVAENYAAKGWSKYFM